MTWAEAWALTSRILLDPDSHTLASVLEWAFVPGPARMAGVDLFENYVNANRGKNATPFHAARPWEHTAPAGPAQITSEDRRQRDHLSALLFGAGEGADAS